MILATAATSSMCAAAGYGLFSGFDLPGHCRILDSGSESMMINQGSRTVRFVLMQISALSATLHKVLDFARKASIAVATPA
jgi:hypothetical protein